MKKKKTQIRKEKAILVGIDNNSKVPVSESLSELYQLARTAGAKVEAKFIQKRPSPHPTFYIGTGKAAELKEYVKKMDINIVIMDDEINPTQESSLEEMLGCKVIDRTRLILDIFGLHASTSVGKLQVELAQLEYFLPRLKNIWTEFSRLGGGIGTRGPGEKKIDVDRSIINDRIASIKKKLKSIGSQRKTMRRKRTKMLRKSICLVGYTNSGKSTLLNSLTNSKAGTANKLFSTLSARTRKVKIDGNEIFLTDTVGFIRKLPHQVVEAFMATLQLVQEADILLHVIDFSSENYRHHVEAVEDVLRELNAIDKPSIKVYNKIDKLSRQPRVQNGSSPSVFISANEKKGLNLLKKEIIKAVEADSVYVKLKIPPKRQDVLNDVYKKAKVINRNYEHNSVIIEAKMGRHYENIFTPYIIK
ncbi:MAG: GTPase HflX [Elusimicrobiota bacterium]